MVDAPGPSAGLVAVLTDDAPDWDDDRDWDDGDAPAAVDPSGPRRWLQIGLIALPLVVIAVMGWQQRWASDDSYINFRVIENIVAGNGPVFNAGERVEAGTSPLWIVVLTVLRIPGVFDLAWIAVVVGLLLTVAAVAVGMYAASIRSRASGEAGLLVPVGMIVFVSVPVVWEFATSGLETGLGFFWLSICFLGLCLRQRDLEVGVQRSPADPWWLPVAIGLGPLVRPDFALVTVVFGVALLALSERSLRGWARCALLAAAAPVAYEVFRIGFYGILVPNTALAKEAGRSLWDRGFEYLGDFTDPYLVWLPLAALAVLGVLVLRPWRTSRSGLIVFLTPVVAGLAHVLYIVKVGGDFMHGRFVLPGLFLLCLPFGVVAIATAAESWPSERRYELGKLLACGAVGIWAVACAATMRVDYAEIDENGIANERGYYTAKAGHPNPITLDDYAAFEWVELGREAAERAEAGEDVLIVNSFWGNFEQERPEGSGVALAFSNVGLVAVASGPEVLVIDGFGLGDPIGSRERLTHSGGRTGHEKMLQIPWALARYAAYENTPHDVRVAQEALTCGALAEVMEATSGDLSFGQVLDNFRNVRQNTSLRFDPNPFVAYEEQCGKPPPEEDGADS